MARLRGALARRAPLTIAVTVLLAAVYLALLVIALEAAEGSVRRAFESFGPIPGEILVRFGASEPGMFARGELWRLLAGALLHGNALHLLVNALSLVALGRLAERLFGKLALGATLFVAAAAGSASSALAGEQAVGASGAIVGIAGLLAAGVRGPGFPAGVPRALRRRIFLVMGLLIGLGLIANRLFKAASVGIAISNTAHAGGFAAGLALGLLLPPPLAESSPTRRIFGLGLAATSVISGAALLCAGIRAVSSALEPREDLPGLLARVVAGGPVRRIRLERFGVSLEVPVAWRIEEREHYASLGPDSRSPYLQVVAVRANDLLAVPEVVVANLREDLERQGAKGFAAAPFESVAIDGRSGQRLEFRYEIDGTELQQVRYIVRAGRRSYSFVFLHRAPFADLNARRVMPSVKIEEAKR